MEFKLTLNNSELMKESFEKFIAPFENLVSVRNNIIRKFKIGIVHEVDKTEDIKLALYYDIEIEQIDLNSQKIVSKSKVEYIFIFEEEDGKVINSINNKTFEQERVNELLIFLNKLSYPYIKEHLEAKYSKANISLKLPLEFTEDNK